MSWLCDGDGRAVGRPRFKCDGTCAENRFRLYRRGRQFSRLLAAEVCASTVVMLNTQCSKVVWRALATHTIRQFPLPFLSRASPCAITFQLESTTLPLSVHRHIMGDFRLFTFKINERIFVCFWRNSPQWAMASSFTRFLDHTQRRTTVARTPLDEWSARRRDSYLTTHNNHSRQTFMPPHWDSNPQSQQASGRRPTA
jgi:hypothetical protein